MSLALSALYSASGNTLALGSNFERNKCVEIPPDIFHFPVVSEPVVHPSTPTRRFNNFLKRYVALHSTVALQFFEILIAEEIKDTLSRY